MKEIFAIAEKSFTVSQNEFITDTFERKNV